MHFGLAIFSESRRREGHGWKRRFLWVAYQVTEWGPMYVLGNLYLDTTPQEKMIVAFWVPFLLQHHARPDNMSAYAMEDHEAWARRMLLVPVQSFGAIYVLYRYILEGSATGSLRQASSIMLFLGIFKYVESAVALRRGDLAVVRSSFKQLPSSLADDDFGEVKNLELDDEKALLVAHRLFDICKGTFSDYPMEYIDRDAIAIRSIFAGRWKTMFKVFEMELSLMHDILYTKASVVHTWGGYAIRLASPILTAAALLLFWLDYKVDLERIDTVITYTLLWTTLLLDAVWLLTAQSTSVNLDILVLQRRATRLVAA